MFQRLNFILFFLLSFVATTDAQWGAVTAQNDTNRFISSQQKFGLIMQHQNVVIGQLDTTISSAGTGGGNGYKVIVGSLMNYDDNCVGAKIVNGTIDCSGSYEAWRQLEKGTSWYQAARGDTAAQFPTKYAITISTGQDSVVVWDMDTGELWMAWKSATSNKLWAGTVTDIAFKDGILYVSSSASGNFGHHDYLTEESIVYSGEPSTYRITGPNIQQRNDNNGAAVKISTTIGLNSGVVSSIGVTRDPFGLTDELGRPKHWWVVSLGTNTNISIYNPYTKAIYDGSATSADIYNVSMDKRGHTLIATNNSGSEDFFEYFEPVYGYTADGSNTLLQWSGAATGYGDIAWPSAPNRSKALLTDDGMSIVGENANRGFIYSASGVYVLHPNGHKTVTVGAPLAKQRWSSTVNAPIEFGGAVFAYAFEDNTTDSSPYGKTLTATNGGTVSAVFGNGFSGCIGCKLSRTGDADLTPVGSLGISLWAKIGQVTAPAQHLFMLGDATHYIRIYVDTDGTADVQWKGVSATWTGDVAVNVADNEWHHFAIENCGGTCNGRYYIDGELVYSSAATWGGAPNIDEVTIGDYQPGGGVCWSCVIDDFMYSNFWTGSDQTPLTADIVKEIYTEGRKALNAGRPFAGTNPSGALISNRVYDLDALDNGIWAVSFSDANTVQIFDGRREIQQIFTSGGSPAIALIQEAGADSVGIAIATKTQLQWIRPDVDLEKAYLSQVGKSPPTLVSERVVVDSAGIGGIFWSITDGINAAANAGIGEVSVLGGHYGAFNIDNAGDMWVHGVVGGLAFLGGLNNTKPITVVGGPTYKAACVTQTTGVNRLRLTDMAFQNDNGGGASGANCVTLVTGLSGSHFENLYAAQCDDKGFTIHGSWNTFVNILAGSNDGPGFQFDGGTNEGNQFRGGIINANGSHGIFVEGDDLSIVGILARNNAGSGDIFLNPTSDAALIVGNRVEVIGVGSSTNSTVSGNNTVAW
ncbi:MAG: hypothetical protein O3C19_01955 [Bacteroidetes bacterium]|nr:hypothetical protein [Bacteroidota bacterium]